MSAWNDSNADHGTIRVENADSAVILLALGTNYRLSPQVFANKPAEKLKGCPDPHTEISQRLIKATQKGYSQLRTTHINDFSSLTERVQLNIGPKSYLPTDRLLAAYKAGKQDTYLEELFFITDVICLSAVPAKVLSHPLCKAYGTSTSWPPGTVTIPTTSTYK